MLLFVLSDVHGHYAEMIAALEAAGYDPNDPNHLLISLGDNFDRGPKNTKVLEYLESIERKILIRGNHEDMLEDVLKNHRIELIHELNSTGDTVYEFFGRGSIGRDGSVHPDRFVEDRLHKFLGSMKDYFETPKYVFVHGWIPVFDREGLARDEWRLSGQRVWRSARFTEWMSAYRKELLLSGKTIVCGHRSTAYGCQFDNSRGGSDFSPFYGNGMIAIDACTVKSRRVNVLVLEDEVDVTSSLS